MEKHLSAYNTLNCLTKCVNLQSEQSLIFWGGSVVGEEGNFFNSRPEEFTLRNKIGTLNYGLWVTVKLWPD